MKHSEMAALRKAAADMQLIAIMDGDWEMPDEIALTYIKQFPDGRETSATVCCRTQAESE
jgi:hypothetical protein